MEKVRGAGAEDELGAGRIKTYNLQQNCDIDVRGSNFMSSRQGGSREQIRSCLPSSLAIDVSPPLQRRNKREILGNMLNCSPYPNVWIRQLLSLTRSSLLTGVFIFILLGKYR